MKNVIFITVLLLLCKLSTAQQNLTRDTVQWLSFEQLTDSLATNPKKVLVFLHTDWCVYCRKMLKETFADVEVVKKLNTEYYAVHFDAERTDTVYFDGGYFTNLSTAKQEGQFHHLATILSGNHPDVFPKTLLFDPTFKLITQEHKYLSTKQLLRSL